MPPNTYCVWLKCATNERASKTSEKEISYPALYFWVGGVVASITNWALGGLNRSRAILDHYPRFLRTHGFPKFSEEEPGARRSQEEPRRSKEEPRRSQEPKRSQEEPRSSQEEPG